MIVAIMQPYFFPYIGYFQLMQAVDTFVVYDDVQYIYGGWINRNRIPIAGKPAWLTMPLKNANYKLLINQREYLLGKELTSMKRRLQAAYFETGISPEWDLVDELLSFPQANVASFNANLLQGIACQLGIRCKFLNASSLCIERTLRGQQRVIAICRKLQAAHYVNPIGGSTLYDEQSFLDAGIKLSFLQTNSMPARFEQGVSHLSIIDGLIRTGIPATRAKLNEFTLHSPKLCLS